MKWWVLLLAMLVLLVFGTLSFVYVQKFVHHKPHGIILFVANGLDLNLLQKARQQALARGTSMQIDRLNEIASLEVKGVGQPLPDEAAASTALATGTRVHNGFFGENALGQRLDTLIYAAQAAGRATGLVTTSELTMPTPASFYGHGKGLPGEELQNAADLVDSGKINVVLGGGGEYFVPADVLNEHGRRDSRNLFSDAEKMGYKSVRNTQDLEQVPVWRQRIFGLFAQQQFIFSSLRDQRTIMPTLSVMTRQAIRSLQYNYGGYFLVVEHGLVATAAKNNWTQPALDEVAELDSAIGTALDYAGTNALVIVTNNYNLSAMESYRDSIQVYPPAPGAIPQVTYEWLSGPGGIPLTPEDKAWLQEAYQSGKFSSVRGDLTNPGLAVYFSQQAQLTTAPAWLASRGPGSIQLAGFLNNTDLYIILKGVF